MIVHYYVQVCIVLYCNSVCVFECLNHLIINHCFMSGMNIALCWRWSMSTRRRSRLSVIVSILWCHQQLLSVVIRRWLLVSCLHDMWVPSKRMAVASSLSDLYRYSTRIWWECVHMCLNTQNTYINTWSYTIPSFASLSWSFCFSYTNILYMCTCQLSTHEYYCIVWWSGH